jgi:tetratricopeptide (TPR) repeat protein
VSSAPEPGATLESGQNQVSKDSPEYFIASGNQSTLAGRLDSAIADYSKAIQRDSSSGIAYFNRGLAHLKKGQSSDATSDFTKAAELFRSSGDSSKLRKTEEILEELGRA